MSSSASVDLKAIGELNAVPEKLNIAVIGGGIAGLTAAYLLSQKHNVTMYEQHEAGGLDAFSVDLGVCSASPIAHARTPHAYCFV